MNAIDADRALFRYKRARNAIGTHSPDGYVRTTELQFPPLDKSFGEAKIFMGSHIDQNPRTEDRIEIWNSRRENGREVIHREVFVESSERIGFTLKKTPVVHVFHHVLMAPGNVFVGAALTTLELTTGKPVRSLVDDAAASRIDKIGWHPDRYANAHDPASMAGWVPEPVPDYLDPDEVQKTRHDLGQLRDAVVGELGGGGVKEAANSVTVGNVTLPRRSAT